MPRIPRSSSTWIVASAILCLMVIALMVRFAALERGARRQHVLSEAQVKTLIARNLPKGSTYAEVVAFLDAHAVAHSGYQPDRHVRAIIRKTRSNWIVRTDIALDFSFDETGKLVRCDAREVFTGP